MTHHIALPLGKFFLADAAHPTKLDWRRVEAALVSYTNHKNTQKLSLRLALSVKKDGRSCSDLYNCPQFRGNIHRIFTPLLENTLKVTSPLNRMTSFGQKRSDSPAFITIALDEDGAAAFFSLTAHERLAINVEADLVRMQELARKKSYGG